jgi:hypothetical protein
VVGLVGVADEPAVVEPVAAGVAVDDRVVVVVGVARVAAAVVGRLQGDVGVDLVGIGIDAAVVVPVAERVVVVVQVAGVALAVAVGVA